MQLIIYLAISFLIYAIISIANKFIKKDIILPIYWLINSFFYVAVTALCIYDRFFRERLDGMACTGAMYFLNGYSERFDNMFFAIFTGVVISVVSFVMYVITLKKAPVSNIRKD